MSSLTPDRVREIAQDEAALLLISQTMPKYPAYFFEGQWLVTYEWLQFTRAQLQIEIDELRREVRRLSRPWYKRWFER